MSTPAVRVEALTKLFRRMAPGFPRRTFKSALLDRSFTAGLRPEETIQALTDVTFSIGRGEAFGVIGSNGSGKSTLLKVVAGILKPTTGRVIVDGSVAALIELGAGFHPEISGRENVFINGAVLGLSRRELERRYDEIVEFSGLGEFMEEPVKNYSSGMYVRLGFSVAIHTDPEVLLVDEVLAVGDEAFAHRCLRRIEELLARGRTVLMVSHSLSLIEEMSNRVLWLERGKLRLLGSPRRVVDAYRQAVAEEEGRSHRAKKEGRERELARDAAAVPRSPLPSEVPAAGAEPVGGAPPVVESAPPETLPSPAGEEGIGEPLRWGSREVEVVKVRLRDGDGAERYHFRSGETVHFEVEVRAAKAQSDFVFGIAIATPRGVECWGTNTHLEGYLSRRLEGSGVVSIICRELRLAPGEYVLDIAVHARDGAPYDYHRRLLSFTVTAPTGGVGVYFPAHRWAFAGGIHWASRPRERTGDGIAGAAPSEEVAR